jgi:hypothetical protein
MAKEIPAFLRAEIGNNAPIRRKKRKMVCAAALRRCALSLLKASSIGLRSGEILALS